MRFFPCPSCSLTVFLAAWKVSLRGSRVYFWLSHSSMQSCCQEVDFCMGRPQVKKRHPSSSSWNPFCNASLAPGSWSSNPCRGHFCLRLPLILCNSLVTGPHIVPLWISTTFFFPDEQFWEETFQMNFFNKKIQKACEYKRGKFDYCLESTSWYSVWLFLPSSVVHRHREFICIYRGRKVFGCLQCLQQTFRCIS